MGLSLLVASASFVIIPTLANQLSSTESSIPSEATQPNDSIQEGAPTPMPSDALVEATNEPSSTAKTTATYSITTTEPSPTASPTPSVLPVQEQSFEFKSPLSLKVDPRAQTLFLPRLILSGANNALVCITSIGAIVDINNLNKIDDQESSTLRVLGDLSSFLMISGDTGTIANLVNEGKGLALLNYSKPLVGSSVTFQLVATSGPILNSSACLQGLPTNTKTIQVLPLGINLEIRKGDLPLRPQGAKG